MKKLFMWLFILVSINVTSLNAMEKYYKKMANYYNQGIDYLHNLFRRTPSPALDTPSPEAFMHTRAFEDFEPLKDQSGKWYPTNDMQEFDPSYKFSSKLCIRCSKLQKGELPIDNEQDKALLNYAKSVIQEEKDRDAWYKENLQTEEGKRAHYYETTVLQKSKKPGEAPEIVKIRQDYKSPYYKYGKVTEGMQKILSPARRESLSRLNARENTEYHDELKFLQTQLHKLDLDWNLPTRNRSGKIFLKTPQDKEEYLRRRKLLEDEIKWFKSDKGRGSFTKSSMKRKDFRAIQEMRNAYEKSQKEN